MGFVDPNKLQEDDELPGGSGLQLDLETKVCPDCGREALPWQVRCQDCGTPTVLRTEVPAPRFDLPHLDDGDDGDTGDGHTG